jgi:hypothetical protein
MRHRRAFLKVAAVASSALLIAGFVGYSVGAFHWLLGPGLRWTRTEGEAVGGTAGSAGPAKTFMGGSKSKIITLIPETGPEP